VEEGVGGGGECGRGVRRRERGLEGSEVVGVYRASHNAHPAPSVWVFGWVERREGERRVRSVQGIA
jgi:hypothetical protein